MADSKKYNGSTWQHSLRKLTTATDTLTTLPADLYADGNNATVGLVGNMSQTGTPTPSSPIQPSETGERTANLFDKDRTQGIIANAYINQSGQQVSSQSYYLSYPIEVNSDEVYTWSFNSEYGAQHSAPTVGFYDQSDTLIGVAIHGTAIFHFTFTVPNNAAYMRASVYIGTSVPNITPMLLVGSTSIGDKSLIPYIPYGYKIPISSGGTTTNIYTTKPLRKIGDIADTINADGTVTYNIYKHELTGQETWNRTSTGKMYSSDALNGIPNYLHTLYDVTMMCSHYVADINYGNTGHLSLNEISLYGTEASVSIREIYIYPDGYATAADFATYLQQQYANGTPATIWFIMETPTTESVTVPPIPTLSTADTFDVLTSLKPSAVYLTYTGWHDVSVGEWDGSDWT